MNFILTETVKASFSPELQLLLFLCNARVKEEPPTAEEFTSILTTGKPLDWREFLRLVLYHRMLPIVSPLLVNHAGSTASRSTASRSTAPRVPAPDEFMELFSLRLKKHHIRALSTSAELLRLSGLFQQEGIAAVSLKGPLLAHRLYGDVTARHSGDIDLLVPAADILRVHRMVVSQGYVVQQGEHSATFSSPAHLKAYMAANYHTSYLNKKRGQRLEIHFRLFKNRHYFSEPMEMIFQKARSVEHEGVVFKTLPVEEEIIYLLAHGANHRWFRLKWLLDIALLCRDDSVDWENVIERTKALKLERPTAQGLMLAHLLLDVPLPNVFPQLRMGQNRLARLVNDAVAEIGLTEWGRMRKYRFPELRKKPYLMRLKTGLLYKCSHLRMFFYFDSNRELLNLPDRWFFLYYLLNPFLWLFRKSRRFRKSARSAGKKRTD